MAGKLHPVLSFAWSAYAILFGGTIAISALVGVSNVIREEKKKQFAPRCDVCRGKGFYSCKLCRGVSTIKWSPLHDPIAINPCVCPTCDGNRVQRCLNCVGKGYI